ncbi:hypothetical protein CJF42_04240 [Pseudoalteromonas sp. NBT06-2]|uniref:SpoIIE family protein phosphatase n=1 Tax=Pseudoalteromonas sp. NBT06-2 TaxID=2025950 RepID=UPI000BA79197|nr:SpoIIE family protein phosphatase [Pseudoalteromonas sp. NBT06-2]PAJ75536.1 hypothetical protein CJF42_04240 [Pseudoalteromonas sp. NBT06-2]
MKYIYLLFDRLRCHFTLAKVIFIVCIFFLIICIILGTATAISLIKLNKSAQLRFKQSQKQSEVIFTAYKSVNQLEASLIKLIAASKPKTIRVSTIASIKANSLLDEAIQNLKEQLSEDITVQKLTDNLIKIKPQRMKIIKYGKSNKDNMAFDIINKITPEVEDIAHNLGLLIDEDKLRISNLLEKFEKQTLQTLETLGLIILLGIVFLFIINNRLRLAKDELKKLNQNLELKVKQRTKQLESSNDKIELINKNTKASITYASLIQCSIVPVKSDYNSFFEDSFVFWQPRDIVGGDIFVVDNLNNDYECLIMVIDCTGHGVPGAFVTMLVKAIERQIITSIILESSQYNISNIFSVFNKELKKILKQEKDSTVLSNVGFDGAILYYNKSEKIIKYAGGNTPLFYVKEGELNIIKGDKQSIGYKGSDSSYQFNEYTIKAEKGMIFYITTDGYLDQNGGGKLFPLGKKRFKNTIINNYYKPLKQQKEIFINEFNAYKGSEEQTDDITLLALKL